MAGQHGRLDDEGPDGAEDGGIQRAPERRRRRKLGEASSSVWAALKDVGGLAIVDGRSFGRA